MVYANMPINDEYFLSSQMKCNIYFSPSSLPPSLFIFLQAESEIDIESIPLPASVLNRRSASFRQPYRGTSPTQLTNKKPARSLGTNRINKLNNQSFKSSTATKSKASSSSRFKLVDLLNSQKNKITSIDIHNNPTLSHLNATIRKICRNNTSPSSSSHHRIPPPPPPPGDSSRASTIDRRRKPHNTFEAFVCDANDYHNFHQHHHHNNHLHHHQYHAGSNQLMSLTVPELSNAIGPRINAATANDIHSVHTSNCNLATGFRASNQSIVPRGGGITAGGVNSSICGGNVRGHAMGCSNSAINLKYGSLRSYKGMAGCNGMIGNGVGCSGTGTGRRTKRSNSEQLNPSYFHFQNIDGDFGGGEMDNNAFDSVLLPPQSCDNHKLPWKHRQCPSITSSSSGSSGRAMFLSKFTPARSDADDSNMVFPVLHIFLSPLSVGRLVLGRPVRPVGLLSPTAVHFHFTTRSEILSWSRSSSPHQTFSVSCFAN